MALKFKMTRNAVFLKHLMPYKNKTNKAIALWFAKHKFPNFEENTQQMKPILQPIAILFSLVFCTSAYAQSKIATTPTTELYGYYQKGQNFETIKPKIENYEAMMALAGYTFTRGNINSAQEYSLLWNYKFEEGGELSVQISYQFLIPFFKITVEMMMGTFPNGEMKLFTLDTEDKKVKAMYESIYNQLVGSLIEIIQPAKTLTKEQLRNALENIDKMPEIKTDKN